VATCLNFSLFIFIKPCCLVCTRNNLVQLQRWSLSKAGRALALFHYTSFLFYPLARILRIYGLIGSWLVSRDWFQVKNLLVTLTWTLMSSFKDGLCLTAYDPYRPFAPSKRVRSQFFPYFLPMILGFEQSKLGDSNISDHRIPLFIVYLSLGILCSKGFFFLFPDEHRDQIA
jgi:hypothetical protein